MLLVDHDERQVAELHRRLDQGVRADQQRQLAGGEPRQDLPPSRGGCGSGEQRDRYQAAEQAVESGQVLLGQRLGGRHERCLGAVLDGAQHRVQRHDGLPRAHLPHEQPVHGRGRLEILVDSLDRASLVRRG